MGEWTYSTSLLNGVDQRPPFISLENGGILLCFRKLTLGKLEFWDEDQCTFRYRKTKPKDEVRREDLCSWRWTCDSEEDETEENVLKPKKFVPFLHKDMMEPDPQKLCFTARGKHSKPFKQGTLFADAFGSDTVKLAMQCKISNKSVALFYAFRDALNQIKLTDREKAFADSKKGLFSREPALDEKLYTLKCGTTEFCMGKRTLSSCPAYFTTCFKHQKTEEGRTRVCPLPYDAKAMEQLLIYTQCGYAPVIQKSALELAKAAHYVDIPDLLKLCEIYLVKKIAKFCCKGFCVLQYGDPNQCDEFIDICKAACLYYRAAVGAD